jgi:proteasome lid subunit RPN8/RPN11
LSTPFVLKIPRQLYEEMINQAVAESPNECCGLLAGRILAPIAPPPHYLTISPSHSHHSPLTTHHSPPVGHVERRYPLVNAAASPTEFLSDPKSLFDAVRDMHQSGIDTLAIYHSHPTSPPVPSRTDLERNYYGPDVMNLIISLQNPEQPQMRGWWLGTDKYLEAGWVCEDETGP